MTEEALTTMTEFDALHDCINTDNDGELKNVLLKKPTLIDNLWKELNYKSLLHRTCYKGKERCCKMLLSLGASPNVQSLDNQETPLHIATLLTHEGCLKILLDNPKVRDQKLVLS